MADCLLRIFARNQLCAIVHPEGDVKTDNLPETLLDKKIRVGTSTPKADPSGDYAWELFKKAAKIKAGSFITLSEKALQPIGGPNSVKAPEDRNQYGWMMGEKKAEIFLTCCTNAVLAQKETPGFKIVRIPEQLAFGADYGLLVKKESPGEARRPAKYILSTSGQKILKEYGFETSGIPKEN